MYLGVCGNLHIQNRHMTCGKHANELYANLYMPLKASDLLRQLYDMMPAEALHQTAQIRRQQLLTLHSILRTPPVKVCVTNQIHPLGPVY